LFENYALVKDLSAGVEAALFEGGPGSGNFGHKGRPGHRGGSAPGDKATSGRLAGGGKEFKKVSSLLDRLIAIIKKAAGYLLGSEAAEVKKGLREAEVIYKKNKFKFTPERRARVQRKLSEIKKKIAGKKVARVVKELEARNFLRSGLTPTEWRGLRGVVIRRER
jgi:hypothetical protein